LRPPGSGKPHALAAPSNAGDWITDSGIESETEPAGPLKPIVAPVDGGDDDGGDVVGSGIAFSPWDRMHRASRTRSSLRVSKLCPASEFLTAFITVRQALMAEAKAGEWGLTPDRATSCPTSSPGAGSGKLGTPWARMQSASLIPAVASLETDLLGRVEEPQATTAVAQAPASKTRLHINEARNLPLGISGPE
jgi:hypothetical protein